MRNYGYPPGWLKEAEVKESGLQVKEEGEVNELNHIDISEGPELTLTGLDASKIISYPGFNTPLPDNCNDNPPKRVPKFSRTDNKNDFINTFCKRNKIKCIQKRKVSREEPDSSETSAKKVSAILATDINIKIRLNWKMKRQSQKSLQYWTKQRRSLRKMVSAKRKNQYFSPVGLRKRVRKLMKLVTRGFPRAINGKMALLNLITMLISLHQRNKGHI